MRRRRGGGQALEKESEQDLSKTGGGGHDYKKMGAREREIERRTNTDGK
jgi:hypothetical protein